MTEQTPPIVEESNDVDQPDPTFEDVLEDSPPPPRWLDLTRQLETSLAGRVDRINAWLDEFRRYEESEAERWRQWAAQLTEALTTDLAENPPTIDAVDPETYRAETETLRAELDRLRADLDDRTAGHEQAIADLHKSLREGQLREAETRAELETLRAAKAEAERSSHHGGPESFPRRSGGMARAGGDPDSGRLRSELDETRSQLTESRAEVQRLFLTLDLDEKNRWLEQEAERTEWNQTRRSLERKASEAEEARTHLADQVERLSDQVRHLEARQATDSFRDDPERLSQLEVEVAALRDERNRWLDTGWRWEAERNQRDNEIAQLRHQLASTGDLQAELDRLRTELDELTVVDRQLAVPGIASEGFRGRVGPIESEDDADEQRARLAELEERVVEQADLLADLRADLSSRNRDLERARDALEDQDHELNALRQQLDAVVPSANETASDPNVPVLEARIQDLLDEKKKLSRRYSNLLHDRSDESELEAALENSSRVGDQAQTASTAVSPTPASVPEDRRLNGSAAKKPETASPTGTAAQVQGKPPALDAAGRHDPYGSLTIDERIRAFREQLSVERKKQQADRSASSFFRRLFRGSGG